MIEKLVDHMHWANATIIEWIKEERKRSADFLRLTSHVLNVERVWICRARRIGADSETFKVHPWADLPALNDANHRDFLEIVRTGIEEKIDYQLFNGSPQSNTIEDLIIHAFSHGFHHAGQMATMASNSGESFPNVSYLGFTWRK